MRRSFSPWRSATQSFMAASSETTKRSEVNNLTEIPPNSKRCAFLSLPGLKPSSLRKTDEIHPPPRFTLLELLDVGSPLLVQPLVEQLPLLRASKKRQHTSTKRLRGNPCPCRRSVAVCIYLEGGVPVVELGVELLHRCGEA